MSDAAPAPDSAIGRLLTELSWSGRSIRQYRQGGAGFENVLTVEVLQALHFLPRAAFLGAALTHAQGADSVRAELAREVEHAEVTVLPGDIALNPAGRDKRSRLIVQPDATLTSPSVFALVEAKRIRRSSFQPEQLAREYVAATMQADATGRQPLLLLILGNPPPLPVSGWAQPAPIQDAVGRHLPSVVSRTPSCPVAADVLAAHLGDAVAWITWREIATIVATQAETITGENPSVAACVHRLATAIGDAVARHA